MKIAKSITLAASGIMISRVLGFIRDVLMAGILGAGVVTDVYLVAIRIPGFLGISLASDQSFAAFVPHYSGLGRNERAIFAARVMRWFFALILLLVVISILLRENIIAWLAPGFDASAAALASDLVAITLGYAVFSVAGGILLGLLGAAGHFFFGAVSSGILNVSLIATLVTAFLLNETSQQQIAYYLALAFLLGGALEFSLLRSATAYYRIELNAIGFRQTRPARFSDQGFKSFLRKALIAGTGSAINALFPVLLTAVGSTMSAGTITCVFLAERLTQLPITLIGNSGARVIIPLVSASAWRSLFFEREAYDYAIRLSLPAALLLYFMAHPIIDGLFGRGAFDADDVRRAGETLSILAPLIPIISLTYLAMGGRFARGDVVTLAVGGLIKLAAALAVFAAFSLESEHKILALAIVVTSLANFSWILFKSRQQTRKALLLGLTQALKASWLGLLLMLVILQTFLYWQAPNLLSFPLAMLLCVLVSLIYFALQINYWLALIKKQSRKRPTRKRTRK